MKKLLLIFFLGPATLLYSQTFEGKITYQNSYKSKLPNMTDQQFATMLGSVQEYYIKGGNFRTTTNGSFLQWQVYQAKDNKLYNKMSSSESIYWMDGLKNDDEVTKAEVNKNAVEVLGYSCDELVLTCKNGVNRYYYHSSIGVDPNQYKNLKMMNWSEVVSRSRSLPLKMIIETPQFTATSVATKVERMKLDDSTFALPDGATIEKSPY